jgi:transcriptional regulator with XRE-family HTH domain
MPRAKRELGEYVKRVMKLKGLTQKDVQRLSGGKITDGYVASIAIGRASNPSVDKLKALADGLGVDVNELFHIAGGWTGESKERTNSSVNDSLSLLDVVRKAVVSPDVTRILHEVVSLSPEERLTLLMFIKKLSSGKRKPRRKTKSE